IGMYCCSVRPVPRAITSNAQFETPCPGFMKMRTSVLFPWIVLYGFCDSFLRNFATSASSSALDHSSSFFVAAFLSSFLPCRGFCISIFLFALMMLISILLPFMGSRIGPRNPRPKPSKQRGSRRTKCASGRKKLVAEEFAQVVPEQAPAILHITQGRFEPCLKQCVNGHADYLCVRGQPSIRIGVSDDDFPFAGTVPPIRELNGDQKIPVIEQSLTPLTNRPFSVPIVHMSSVFHCVYYAALSERPASRLDSQPRLREHTAYKEIVDILPPSQARERLGKT